MSQTGGHSANIQQTQQSSGQAHGVHQTSSSGGHGNMMRQNVYVDEAKLAAKHLRLASSTEQEEDDEDFVLDPTVIENTGRWTREEHHMFLKGLEMHGKGWKKIAAFIKTRTVVQIRTHAQKYFLKLQKARQGNESNGAFMEGKSLFGRKKKRRLGDKPVVLNTYVKCFVSYRIVSLYFVSFRFVSFCFIFFCFISCRTTCVPNNNSAMYMVQSNNGVFLSACFLCYTLRQIKPFFGVGENEEIVEKDVDDGL